ncbi:MAG: cytochrome C oxidase subunit II [Myxococcaceae bacterium]|nr:cytochrome C oxidase subunit II [Myxococcaceae bacterium]
MLAALPRDISADGHLISDALRRGLVEQAVLLGVLVVWLVLALVRFRASHAARADRGDSPRQVLTTLGVVAVIFLVVDGSLVTDAISATEGTLWNFAVPAADPDTVRVEVNAHQWAWDFRLAGPDGAFSTRDAPSDDDVLAWNELVVPVDTPVHLQLTSTDVVHGFYVPNLLLKTDVVPGTVRQLWFRATQLGTFEIGCAQHCGVNHYKMRGELKVLPKAEYQAWLREASKVARLGADREDVGARWGWAWKERPR